MIIGICGQAGAGKDLLASILVKNHGWCQMAFADPLKRAAKMLFEFIDDQLWGPSELRNAPDERYPRTHDRHVWKRASDPAMCECVACKVIVDGYCTYEKPCVSYLTPREVLQKLGTEVGRVCYPNIWVERTLADAHQVLDVPGLIYDRRFGVCGPARPISESFSAPQGVVISAPWTKPQGVVISDVRFGNEIDALKKEGYVVRIKRDVAGLGGVAGEHLSETEQASFPDSLFDYVLENDGTIEDLERKAAEMFKVLK